MQTHPSNSWLQSDHQPLKWSAINQLNMGLSVRHKNVFHFDNESFIIGSFRLSGLFIDFWWGSDFFLLKFINISCPSQSETSSDFRHKSASQQFGIIISAFQMITSLPFRCWMVVRVNWLLSSFFFSRKVLLIKRNWKLVTRWAQPETGLKCWWKIS